MLKNPSLGRPDEDPPVAVWRLLMKTTKRHSFGGCMFFFDIIIPFSYSGVCLEARKPARHPGSFFSASQCCIVVLHLVWQSYHGCHRVVFMASNHRRDWTDWQPNRYAKIHHYVMCMCSHFSSSSHMYFTQNV